MLCGMICSVPGLCPLDVSGSLHPPVVTNEKMSPYVAKCIVVGGGQVKSTIQEKFHSSYTMEDNLL